MGKNKAILLRSCHTEKQVIGEMTVFNSKGHPLKKFDTLELKWLDNKRRVSCIEAKKYRVERGNSAKNGLVYWVRGVLGRIGIQIHSGNFYTQIEGCILVGYGLKDINKDGQLDVLNSRKAMMDLYNLDIDEIIIEELCVV